MSTTGTPAHAGGVALFKFPVGRALFNYYGERLLRTDLPIFVDELGSLFEHNGPISGARIFGADRTYFEVTLTWPGVHADGRSEPWCIPARILTSYLAERDIVVEKTDTYTTLVLFSMGITKGKWGTLMDALMDFKALHDTETPLRQVLPRLVERHPKRYGRLTLRGLSQEMHEHLTDADLIDALDTAFQDLPNPVVPPQRCYQQLIWGTERLRLTHAAGRVAAAVVTVTPAGIPVLMPGEALGAPDGPVLRYLGALEAFDRAFPGFHNEAHGVVIDADTGDYLIECVREEIARPSETPDAVAPTRRTPTAASPPAS